MLDWCGRICIFVTIMLKLHNIKEARKAAKKTLRDAGEQIGAHKDRISRIEKGEGFAKNCECVVFG